MVDKSALEERRIQDYIAERLSEGERADVAAFLLAHPDIGAEVDQLRRQNEALKMVGKEILDEPVPDRLRVALLPPADPVEPGPVKPGDLLPMTGARPASRSRFLEAAAAILLFVVGVASGWMANNELRPAPSDDDLAIAGVAQAFSDFGADPDFPIEFPPDRDLELASWIGKSFDRQIAPPDLDTLNYRYVGGRLMPGVKGKIGTFLFESERGNRVAVFFWPRAAPPKKVIELSRQDDVDTRFWFGDGFGFAVVGNANDAGIDKVAHQVFEHYERASPFTN